MNWKNEAIEHLKRYDAMVKAVENIPQELSRLAANQGIRGNRPDKLRGNTAPGPGDDILIANMIRREELNQSYKNAKIWVKTTDQALSVLTQEERDILQWMYIRPERGAVQRLCEHLGVEQSSVYRKRDTALYRFTIALYGAA